MDYLTVNADKEFNDHFNGLQQVFFCITNSCNLRCKHCLYKPWLRQNDDIPFTVACSLMKYFKEMGASKISLLGGEPTLYGFNGQGKGLNDLIISARNLNYEYIRVATNGQIVTPFLERNLLEMLHEISFSFDGSTPNTHDYIRSSGAYDLAIKNLKECVSLGYHVDITMTVNKWNIKEKATTKDSVESLVYWASDLGVKRINFHPILKMGVDRDSWVDNSYITQDEWEEAYYYITQKVEDGLFPIEVRIPQRFIGQKEFKADPKYYGYCPVKLGERVEIHPNGQIQVCALLKGTNKSIATFSELKDHIEINWEQNENELIDFPFNQNTNHPCAIINNSSNNKVPLCISFKPKQKEFIWKKLQLM